MSVICFSPIYKKRVWGGRMLEELYSRKLPSYNDSIGESWDVSDRCDDASIVSQGIHKGKTIHELWSKHREEIFGHGFEQVERFPLLIKILDASADLSLQVHPPAQYANELNGEPKTEMWYIAHADQDAKLYVGLQDNVTKDVFHQAIKNGNVDQLTHSITPKSGESILIQSGRLHAIGAGLVIYEIQQNSDTTYRVFDWNRKGLDGKLRELHIEESMKCIDFDDYTPEMDQPDGQSIAQCKHFHVDKIALTARTSIGNPDPERFSIITVISGELESENGQKHTAGDSILLPRNTAPITANADTKILQTTVPRL